MQTVSDIMTRGVRTVSPSESMTLAAQAMRELNVGSLPVCDHGRLLGVITDRDIAIRGVAEELGNARISDIMTMDALYCFEDDPLDHALSRMKSEQVRRLPVLSRDKQLVGIVALADVATACDSQQSAEVIRDISEPAAPERFSQSAASGDAGGGQTH